MKTYSIIPFIALLSIVFFSSCTIQKRVHRKGWHVEWRQQYKKVHAVDADDRETVLNEEKSAAEQNNSQNLSSEEIQFQESETSPTKTSAEKQLTMDSRPDAIPSVVIQPESIESNSQLIHSTTELRSLHVQQGKRVTPILMIFIVIMGLALILSLVADILGFDLAALIALLFALLAGGIMIVVTRKNNKNKIPSSVESTEIAGSNSQPDNSTTETQSSDSRKDKRVHPFMAAFIFALGILIGLGLIVLFV